MRPPVVSAAAMLCRVDPRGRLGLPFRPRVGPLLFRAGGREPCLLPLTPVGGFVASTPMVRTIERTSSMGMPLIDFVFAELEGEATVLFQGFEGPQSLLQFSEYEQAVLELLVDVSVICKREVEGTLIPRHHPTPDG